MEKDEHRRHSGPKQNSFFGGAAILALGIMVVKLIGMFYRIPLVNIIGEQGNADFTNAYNIYAVLLTISTAGLPVAVSKLVSEANALGKRNQVSRIFRVALILFLSMGVASFLLMYFKADMLAGMMHDEKAAPTMIIPASRARDYGIEADEKVTLSVPGGMALHAVVACGEEQYMDPDVIFCPVLAFAREHHFVQKGTIWGSVIFADCSCGGRSPSVRSRNW